MLTKPPFGTSEMHPHHVGGMNHGTLKKGVLGGHERRMRKLSIKSGPGMIFKNYF